MKVYAEVFIEKLALHDMHGATFIYNITADDETALAANAETVAEGSAVFAWSWGWVVVHTVAGQAVE